MTRQLPLRSSTTLPIQYPHHPPAPPRPHHAPSPVPTLVDPSAYTTPFLDFITENPTVYHSVSHFSKRLTTHGFTKLSERDLWTDKLSPGGKYFLTRNGSALIAFTIGHAYVPGNGAAIIAAHIDALTCKLKPISTKPTKEGYLQLGIAQYGGALNQTWIDRDLGVGGRVLVRDEESGKVETRLVKLGWPIARVPSLAPHFGLPAEGQANRETRMVPIVGLEGSGGNGTGGIGGREVEGKSSVIGGVGAGTFASTQPERLVRAIAGEMGIKKYENIINWELEIFDTQAAQLGGLDKEFIFAGRIDDKVCSFAAIEALIASSSSSSSEADPSTAGKDSSIITVAALFDDEEVGSLLRQGARSNFLPSNIARIVESFSTSKSTRTSASTPSYGPNLLSQTYANSFLLSADVTHAVNPNYMDAYLEGHMPRLNVGVCVAADSNAHMTTDAPSTALLTRIAQKSHSTLQIFQIRNDSRSGGTVGPMLSAMTGIRAIDAGIPQLSMHSIRATTGSLDPGLGVRLFRGFYEEFEGVDGEFRE